MRWGYWDATLPPVLRVRSGETVSVETLSGEPEDMPAPELGHEVPDALRAVQPRASAGRDRISSPDRSTSRAPRWGTCSRWLRGDRAPPGWGWNLQAPLLGTLPEDFPDLRRLHIPLDRDRMVARLPWGQELPLSPFFGAVGVAPPRPGALTSVLPRAFGGNMDNKELVAGSNLYLPMFNERRSIFDRRWACGPGRRRGLPHRHRDRHARHGPAHRAQGPAT